MTLMRLENSMGCCLRLMMGLETLRQSSMQKRSRNSMVKVMRRSMSLRNYLPKRMVKVMSSQSLVVSSMRLKKEMVSLMPKMMG
jgi:hypothetical protein